MIPECDIFPAKITGAVGSKGYPFAEQTVVGGTLTNFVDGRKVTSGDSDLACTVLGGGTVASGDYGTMLMFQDIGQMRYVFVPMGEASNAPQRGIIGSGGEWVYDTPKPLRVQDGALDHEADVPEHASGLTFRPESPTSSGSHDEVHPDDPKYLRHYIMGEDDVVDYGPFIKLLAPQTPKFPWIQFKSYGGWMQDRYRHLHVDPEMETNKTGGDFWTVDPSVLADWNYTWGGATWAFRKGILISIIGTLDEGWTGTIPLGGGAGISVVGGMIVGYTP